MRLFVAQYPREVVGLVLIDTAAETGVTPELQAQMQASIGFYRATALLTATGLMRVIGPLMGESAMPETARKLPPELQEPYLELVMDSRYQATAADEMTQLPETLRQVSAVMRDPAPLGDRPLIVLTAGQQMAPGASPFSEQRVAVDAAVVAAQGRLAGLSSRGEQRIVEESGHQMHLDASEAVVQAIRDAIEQARN
jgi:pimeloyl-ACP methyl ester carboxylesterase